MVGGLQQGTSGRSLPAWVWPAGIVVVAAGLVLSAWAMGTALLLLSVWAIGAALVAAAWIVLRTALEDATLRRELPGYQDYCRRTRFRIVPGVW